MDGDHASPGFGWLINEYETASLKPLLTPRELTSGTPQGVPSLMRGEVWRGHVSWWLSLAGIPQRSPAPLAHQQAGHPP